MDIYEGGPFETNSYFLPTAEGGILIDAAEGVCDWLLSKGARVSTLLITHGHFDHTLDAARVQKQFGCRVVYHPDGKRMLTEPGFFRSFGIQVEPIMPGLEQDEALSVTFDGVEFQVLHVPGHCPGSLCFYLKEEKKLFTGDVLFAGAIGRWDLPGGNRDQLITGIIEKLLPLGDEVSVYPGHGPATTIGRERTTNPFLVG